MHQTDCPAGVVVAQEGCQQAVSQSVRYPLEVFNISFSRPSGAHGSRDIAFCLGGREEEEAVDAALIILRDLPKALPAFTDQETARLQSFRLCIQKAEEFDILRVVSGIEAGHRVQPEAVNPAVKKPESHDPSNLIPDSLAVQVEIRHMAACKLFFVVPVCADNLYMVLTGIPAEIVVIDGRVIRSAGFQRFHSRQKPGVPRGRVVDRQVNDEADAQFMAGSRQGLHIVQRAVLLIHSQIVPYVILVIAGAGHHGHQPDTMKAHVMDVSELADQTAQIANAVAVAVRE